MDEAHNSGTDVAGNEDEKLPMNRKGEPDHPANSTQQAPDSQKDDAFVQGPAVGVDNSFDNHRDSSEYDLDEDTPEEHGSFAQFSSDAEDARMIFPDPDVFNAYPIEVQRKIVEWTDRDVKARRDDESRRQDELMRAQVAHRRMKQAVPAAIIVLAIVCGAITGIVTENPLFSVAFLIIPLVVIIGGLINDNRAADKRKSDNRYRRYN